MATEKRQRAIEKRKKTALKKAKKTSQRLSNGTGMESFTVQMVGDETSADGNTLSTEDVTNILIPETEPLTNKLYQELLEKKEFPKKTLDELKSMGMRYNRVRNSFIDPFTDQFTLIEYRRDPKSGEFALSESKLRFHR